MSCHLSCVLIGVVVLLGVSAAVGAPAAPEKFIPTYVIAYGSRIRPAAETAKFDLLIASFSSEYARYWGSDGKNSWQALKALNPDMRIFLYKMGPGEYDTSHWGLMGAGWEWMKQHHGLGSADRWTATGARYGEYLEALPYGEERLMIVGNPGWQDYFIHTVFDDYWGGGKGVDCRGVDGIFSDNTQYRVIWQGEWCREGHRDDKDDPAEYFRDGQYLNGKWHADMSVFLRKAIPWFADRGLEYTMNFGYMGQHPEYWQELDSLPRPPYAAMEEGGFVCPWGDNSTAFDVSDWESKVRAMRGLRHVHVLMNCFGQLPNLPPTIEGMSVADASGMTGWDALWFSLTSFLMGFDDVARNGYMNFTVWSYGGPYFWFEEFDPKYLHLGKAVGEFEKAGNVYRREFRDGWVVANPSAEDAVGLAVPRGRARVINHDNFRDPQTSPLVTSFDLRSHRGVVLLKEGRQIGNADNQ